MLYQMMTPWLEKLMRKSVNTIPHKQVQKQSILFIFLIICAWVCVAAYILTLPPRHKNDDGNFDEDYYLGL